jgi:hypothetical protein
VHEALAFFLEWPEMISVAALVEARVQEFDGAHVHLLTPAAEALRARHPLAATLVWRVLIEDALWEGRTARYGAAADHLMDCAAAQAEIEDYRGCAPHGLYLEQLRQTYSNRSLFWKRAP